MKLIETGIRTFVGVFGLFLILHGFQANSVGFGILGLIVTLFPMPIFFQFLKAMITEAFL